MNFSYLFSLLVLGEDVRCILRCILALGGVSYFARGSGNHNSSILLPFVVEEQTMRQIPQWIWCPFQDVGKRKRGVTHHAILEGGETHYSEAWGPPQFQEKGSRSEKAILGALGEFRGILRAALGIRNSILGIRNSTLGMASHDLSSTKATILGATPGAIPGIEPAWNIFICPCILGAFFRELGWSPRARTIPGDCNLKGH